MAWASYSVCNGTFRRSLNSIIQNIITKTPKKFIFILTKVYRMLVFLSVNLVRTLRLDVHRMISHKNFENHYIVFYFVMCMQINQTLIIPVTLDLQLQTKIFWVTCRKHVNYQLKTKVIKSKTYNHLWLIHINSIKLIIIKILYVILLPSNQKSWCSLVSSVFSPFWCKEK